MKMAPALAGAIAMSFATVPIGTRPDQDVAFAIFVIEEVGIDGEL